MSNITYAFVPVTPTTVIPVNSVIATPVITTAAALTSATAGALQLQQHQQQSAVAIAQQQAEVRAKIEEEAQRKMLEGSISHEENMSISGSNARYMVMQKLSRKSKVGLCTMYVHV